MKRLISFLVVCMMSLLQVTPVMATNSMALEDDYVVYTIDEKSINKQGQIEIDGQKLADALMNKAWSKKPGSNWMPGDTSIGKVKFINKLPYTIRFQDYSVKVPTYEDTEFIGTSETLRTSLPTHGSTGLKATGKDGNVIPIGLNCFRCANKAIAALYNKKATQMTLEDLIHLEDKIKEEYPELSTYGEYLCYYYRVSSLDELTRQQKSEILDGNSFYVREVGNEDVLKEEKTLTYACSENNGSLYIVHEFDKEVIELGYNYYFDSLMMFSFDKSLADISQDQFDYTIMNYLDENSKVRQQLDQFLIGKTILPHSELTFDSIQYHISAPLMGNAYSNRDVPSFLTFTFQLEPVVIDGYAFQDGNNDGVMQKKEERVEGLKINLWQDENLIATTLTNKEGYYCFDNQIPGKSYYITTDGYKDYTVTKMNLQNYYGNRFFTNDQKIIKCAPFVAKEGHEFYNVGFVEVTYLVNYEANGGKGEQVDEKNPYHENDQVTILGQGEIKREGYQFMGWNTQSDGKGKTYLENDSLIMPSHNITLYALWQKDVLIDVEKPDEPISTDKVQTSDNNKIMLFASLMILTSIGSLFVVKSLKKNR